MTPFFIYFLVVISENIFQKQNILTPNFTNIFNAFLMLTKPTSPFATILYRCVVSFRLRLNLIQPTFTQKKMKNTLEWVLRHRKKIL